ncbi:tetratricopeptide repeat protein [endosymbiont of unidentified scaly snail isolate Monju]|uniref:tetratricopeptide repeat protein n=1 Tax=endosymbiont of unidentified scaly snail isolate Monju TaxID=1248727 RepID=UPI001494EC99|nr:tetratricopeptide repeat protein [endosymbiont of unidentified scaly snail isolate Monju]
MPASFRTQGLAMPLKRLSIAAVCLLLGACGSPYRMDTRPAPVESVSGQRPADTATALAGGGTEVRPYRPPAQVARVRPTASPAVRKLLRKAAAQRRAGDYAAAQASIERALRIESRNPRLWNRLAHLYADQGQYAWVESFAAKSNALAGSDPILQADNWQLIATTREALGDRRGAEQARRRARIIQ